MNTYITEWHTRTGMIFAGPRITAESWKDASAEAHLLDVCLVGELKAESGGEE